MPLHIIDFHTHILPQEFVDSRQAIIRQDNKFAELFSNPKNITISAEQLIDHMDANGVDKSVVLGYGWTDNNVARLSNEYMLESAERYPNRIIPFCSVALSRGDFAISEAERCINSGAQGIGELHLTHGQLANAQSISSIGDLMKLARNCNLPVVIHASEPLGKVYIGKGDATPDATLKFATAFPNNRIVFAHFGGGLPFYALMPSVADKLHNVWFDTATAPYIYNSAVTPLSAQIVGTEKILFGSDFPIITQKRSLQHILSNQTLTKESIKSILSTNASNLINTR